MSDDATVDAGRLGRLLVLIAVVTAVFLWVGTVVLPGTLFSIAVAAVGSVALVTAITGFLIAAASGLETDAASEVR